MSGGKIRGPVPSPPATIPIARERFSVKYCEMVTIEGMYVRPRPVPTKNRINYVLIYQISVIIDIE